MGAQFSKAPTNGEIDAEKSGEVAVSPSKSNGQENGCTVANGEAAEGNGPALSDGGPNEEAEPAVKLGAEEDLEKKDAASTTDGSAKTEDGAAEGGESSKKKKKRFSFKKSFKLSGFSLKKTKKESGEEAEDEGATVPTEEALTSGEPAADAPAAAEEEKNGDDDDSSSRDGKLEETVEEEPRAKTPPGDQTNQLAEETPATNCELSNEPSTQEAAPVSETPSAAD